MSAGQLAVLLAAVLCSLGFAALVVVLLRVLDALRTVEREVSRLRVETQPLLDELRSAAGEARATVDRAREDLERFDRVLGSAESISEAVSGSSRLVRGALSTPVIKTVAFASGTAEGVRRFRRKGADDPKSLPSGSDRRGRRRSIGRGGEQR